MSESFMFSPKHAGRDSCERDHHNFRILCQKDGGNIQMRATDGGAASDEIWSAKSSTPLNTPADHWSVMGLTKAVEEIFGGG